MNPAFNVGDRVRTTVTSHPMSSRGMDGVVETIDPGDTNFPYQVRLSRGDTIFYAAHELTLLRPTTSPQTGADAQGLRDRAAALRSDADALDRAADILEQIK